MNFLNRNLTNAFIVNPLMNMTYINPNHNILILVSKANKVQK
jgi:hypothetical protein